MEVKEMKRMKEMKRINEKIINFFLMREKEWYWRR
jgi:hypothetical protein